MFTSFIVQSNQVILSWITVKVKDVNLSVECCDKTTGNITKATYMLFMGWKEAVNHLLCWVRLLGGTFISSGKMIYPS